MAASAKARAAPSLLTGPTESTLQPLATTAARRPTSERSGVLKPESAKSAAVIAARTRYAIIAGVLAGDRGDGKAGAPLRWAITRCCEPWRGGQKPMPSNGPRSGPGRADLHFGQGRTLRPD